MRNTQLPRGFVTELPLECLHVREAWTMLGGRIDWTQVLVVADLVEGDAELLVEGLLAVREETARYESEKQDGKSPGSGATPHRA